MLPLTPSERARSENILAELALTDDEYRQYRARHEQLVGAASIADRDATMPPGEAGLVCRPLLWTSPIFHRAFVIFDLQRECSDPAPLTMEVPGGTCILVPNGATSPNLVDLELIRRHQVWRCGEARWTYGTGALPLEDAVDAFFERFSRDVDAYHLNLTHYPAADLDLSCEQLALGNAVFEVVGDALLLRLVEPDALGLLLATIITQAGPRSRALGFSSRGVDFLTKHIGVWSQSRFSELHAQIDGPYIEAASEFFMRALALGDSGLA